MPLVKAAKTSPNAKFYSISTGLMHAGQICFNPVLLYTKKGQKCPLLSFFVINPLKENSYLKPT